MTSPQTDEIERVGAVSRLRHRIDSIVGGHGFVTISVSDAREILGQCSGGELLDQIDAIGGKVTVTLPAAQGEA